MSSTPLFTRYFYSRTLLAICLLVLQACSGGSGTSPTVNPQGEGSGDNGNTYTGPEPQTADIQAFRVNVWENIRGTDRCGACHNEGGQSPVFARSDDVNIAYGAANTVVNLSNPAGSRMVTKVSEGHNCWQGSDSAANTACANIIEGYISAWASDSNATSANVIQLVPPPIKDAGASKNFPSDANDTLFASTVHPLLTSHCASCHTPESNTPQQPYFAVADISMAYQAAKIKIDLDAPASSRLVVRLGDEFHNCWSASCQNDASAMAAQITEMAQAISVTQPDPSLLLSKALTLSDGILANSSGRYEDKIIALYEFRSGIGNTAFDTSGISPEMNLTLTGDVSWVGGWGIHLGVENNQNNGKAQATTSNSKKLFDLITATGEYSIEAWIAPANVTQGEGEDPARIVSYSAGTSDRNFTLGQNLYNYEYLNRSSNTNANGGPALATDDGDEDLQATLQHVVATVDPVAGRRLYVDGVFTDDQDAEAGGTLGDWNDTYAFVLGNEVSGNRLWQGVIRMVAIHNRALNQAQILQNYQVGVGEKFYLLFSISHLVDTPDSYIVFEVSQFDNYSYLFNTPFYVTLDPDSSTNSSANPISFPLQGMRIGINGREANIGQSYAKLDTVVNTNNQALSELGTIIALEKGSELDEFFLSFEILGNNSNVVITPIPTVIPATLEGSGGSDIGLRTFDAINASMGEITGINIAGHPNLLAAFNTIRKSLPVTADIETFMSSHQMSIVQLGIGYCDALIDTQPEFFSSVDFDSGLLVANRNLITTPLANALLGNNIITQPDQASVEAELNALFDELCGLGSNCSSSQTRPASKGVCAAALSNAAMLIK